MTLRELVSALALQEGKKHQASVGDVRELIKLLRNMIEKDVSIAALLLKPVKKK